MKKGLKITASESQVLHTVQKYVNLIKSGFMQRNNVGALMNKQGRIVRYGLCNESKAMNDKLKSSDLIGWVDLIITQEMVGTHIAQYAAFEVKPQGWVYSGKGREKAQKAYIDLVNSKGGYARFVTGIEDVYAER
jgi:hypothetical protein